MRYNGLSFLEAEVAGRLAIAYPTSWLRGVKISF
jgi:hypothetical protein